MTISQCLPISMILLMLLVVLSDASLSRLSRQTTTDQCPYPDLAVCDFIQCANGRCLEDKSSADCYKCQCAPGYTGQICDTPISTPTGCNPGCENGGQCQQTGTNTYACVCPPEYTGNRCETSVLSLHPCVTNPGTLCQNSGTCTTNGAGYLCNCAAGWTGTNCETQSTISSCSSNPCGTHGTCVEGILPTGTAIFCNCETGWTGKYCDVNQSGTCSTGFCLSGGTCQLSGSIAYCVCPPTHTGSRCETSVGILSTTTTTTTVTTTTTTITITSTMTTSISTLTTPLLGSCSTNPCLNGGSCFNTGNSFVCLCKQGWSGQTCSLFGSTTLASSTTPSNINICSPNPCMNGGKCLRHGNGYVCVCTLQYTGSTCASPKTTTTPATNSITCANQPCQNGGLCFNAGNSYYCYCGSKNLYTGKNCETVNVPSATDCSLNCAPGYCVNAGGTPALFACMCNGTMTPTSCSTK